MNYLAHAYLSFNHPEITVGNMISDFVKGKKKFNYSNHIQQGIQLHRSIDTFIDMHETTAEAKKVFKPSVGLYAGAFVDVAYDHFLATDVNELTEDEWLQFAENTYETLYFYKEVLPANFALLLPYMHSQNWLFNYRYSKGIENSFVGLARRAKYLQSSEEAFVAFEKNYDVLKLCYQQFFSSAKAYAFQQLNQILNSE